MNTFNIFFPAKALRDYHIQKIFNIKDVVNDISLLNRWIPGVNSIHFKREYKKIPGYWVKIQSSDETVTNKIYKEIPRFWIDKEVFFPTELKNQSMTEELWEQKYNLEEEKYNSDAWRIFFQEGKKHLEEGRIDIAKAAFICIYKRNPFFLKKYKRYYVFEDLAYLYEEKGELHKSIRCLKIQAVLQPNSSEAYLNMSNFLLLNGLDQQAIEVCKQGLEINPDDEYLSNNILVGYMHCEYYNDALEYLHKLIKKYPTVSTNWKMLGDVFFQIGKDQAAITCYQKALSINSRDMEEVEPDIYYSMGICYQQLSELEKAIDYYEKFLTYDHTDPIILLNLSKVYGYHLKEYDKAEYYAKIVVELYPQNGYGYHNLGLIYLYTDRLENAKWYLYKARKLLPEYQPVHDAIIELKSARRKYPAF